MGGVIGHYHTAVALFEALMGSTEEGLFPNLEVRRVVVERHTHHHLLKGVLSIMIYDGTIAGAGSEEHSDGRCGYGAACDSYWVF